MRGHVFLISALSAISAAGDPNGFVGQWDLTPANGGAGWLEVRAESGAFAGSLLWMGGSPEIFPCVYFDENTLHAIRVRNDEVRDTSGTVTGTRPHPITLTATVSGDALQGVFAEPSSDGTVTYKMNFTGTRTPPLPPRPDLSQVKFGDPIALFDETDLQGWAVIGGAHWTTLKTLNGGAGEGWVAQDDSVENGWSVTDGVLANNPVQHEGRAWIRYGNLQTMRDFEDFNLTLEVNVPIGGNSGIYLRGIYEIQVVDSYRKPLDCHHMGAVYGRICPAVPAEKPAGEWQTLDITLVTRHATVKLNGQTIIDNQPIAGCTGGALWSNQLRSGPIYLQGDHTAVKYRNMVLRPVVR